MEVAGLQDWRPDLRWPVSVSCCRTNGRAQFSPDNPASNGELNVAISGCFDSTKTAETAKKQRALRCYFVAQPAGSPGFPRRTRTCSLIISWKNSEKQREAPSEEDHRVRRGRARPARCSRAGPRVGPSEAEYPIVARSARGGAGGRLGCRFRSTSGRCRIAGFPSVRP